VIGAILAIVQEEKDVRSLAREYALRKLDRRECSTQDILRHLTRKGIPPETASEVLSSLTQLNLVSDERYAKLLTREQAARGKGPQVIRQKLREKGIHLDLGQTKALAEAVTQTSELESAKALAARRYPEAWKDKKEMLRALQGLMRRGFSYSIAREALACPETEE